MRGADLERDCRMRDVCILQVPLWSKDYEIQALSGRAVQVDGEYVWRMGIRLGPNARSGG